MRPGADLSDRGIFEDVSTTIGNALEQVHARDSARTHITRTAFAIALEQLS